MGGVNLLFIFSPLWTFVVFDCECQSAGALCLLPQNDLLAAWHCPIDTGGHVEQFYPVIYYFPPQMRVKKKEIKRKKSFKEEARHFLKLTLIKARLLL